MLYNPQYEYKHVLSDNPTHQELFDFIARHIFTQGKRAVKVASAIKEICQYRTEDGLKCAVGAIIPDRYYNKGMEGQRVGQLKYELPEYFKNSTELLSALQELHDDKANWHDTMMMQDAFDVVAHAFNLDTTYVKTLSFSDR